MSALYQSHGLHDIGLETLRLLSLEPEKLEYPPRGAGSDLRGVTGVWAAVQYLSKLTGDCFSRAVTDWDLCRGGCCSDSKALWLGAGTRSRICIGGVCWG